MKYGWKETAAESPVLILLFENWTLFMFSVSKKTTQRFELDHWREEENLDRIIMEFNVVPGLCTGTTF